ncbi:MAG: xylose isomerase [Gemmatimonadetes bacterium]|nr:MAG: xylose isomerase [Gemmatimonadota bacterium]
MGDQGMDRRRFLATASAAAAAAALGGCASSSSAANAGTANASRAAGSSRLPIGFSTLGTPKWTWIQTLDFAAAHGFAAVELRGILDQMDLSKVPEFQPSRLAQTKRELADRGLVVPDLGASINLHEQDQTKRAAAMAETRRFIDLASAMETPYVRVFGNEYPKGMERKAVLEYIGAGLRELGEYGRPRNVSVIIESHGAFTDSPSLLELMRLADSPNVAILWDAHHTFVGGEQPENTVAQLGKFIRHTHLKDSVPSGTDRKYVLTGTGEVPVKRQVAALARIGYKGYYSFEWEKRWHPEIEEPEVAVAQYATVMAGYLRDAGITASASR